ncbi:putative UPF0481 protein [Tanacetum coccineum]
MVPRQTNFCRLVVFPGRHKEDPKLQEFEWMKECYLDDLLHRSYNIKFTPEKTLDACLQKVNTLIPQIRESYAGMIEKYSDDEVAKMMVMDGCFILEFCLKHVNEDLNLPNKMQNNRIAMDLLLLENQVPFFVLQALSDCSIGKASRTTLSKLLKCLARYIRIFNSRAKFPETTIHFYSEKNRAKKKIHDITDLDSFGSDSTHDFGPFPTPVTTDLPKLKIHDFTDLDSFGSDSNHDFGPFPTPVTTDLPKLKIHDITDLDSFGSDSTHDFGPFPTPVTTDLPKLKIHDFTDLDSFGSDSTLVTTNLPKQKTHDTTDHVLGYLHKRFQLLPVKSLENTHTAVHLIEELDRSGINLKPHQMSGWSMNIDFQSSRFASLPWFWSKPTLLMPTLVIHDFTELILRNFIAYEQSFPQDRSYFTSYAHAMDMLINTQEDVAKLVESKVFVNILGSNQEAADMINKICKNMIVKEFYYTDEFKEMDKYYNALWPKHIARLRRVYFNNQWSAIALLAAIILFTLAVVQTIYAIKGK